MTSLTLPSVHRPRLAAEHTTVTTERLWPQGREWWGLGLIALLHIALLVGLSSSLQEPVDSSLTPPSPVVMGVLLPQPLPVADIAPQPKKAAEPLLPTSVATPEPMPPKAKATKAAKPAEPQKPLPAETAAPTEPEVAPTTSAPPSATTTSNNSAPVVAPQEPSAALASAAPTAPTPAPAPAPVTPPSSEASHLNNPAPRYPAMSRRMGEQGQVLLDVYILANGTVGEAKLKRSSGFARLDQSALEVVRSWRYVPAKRGDVAIPLWYVQPISFSLNG